MLGKMKGAIPLVVLSVGSGLAACGGVRPYEMSAAEHEQAARDATQRRDEKVAAAHAAAARALLSEERRACDGVPSRDVAPGVAGLEILRMSTLERPVKTQEVVEGAAVVVEASGRSVEAFDQLMRCRAAHAAVTRDARDPLSVAGATVRVYRDDGDAVVVQLRSRDPKRAGEIVERVERQLAELAPLEDGRGSDGDENQHLTGPPRDASTADPRTHGSAPVDPIAPGGFPPIGISPGRRIP